MIVVRYLEVRIRIAIEIDYRADFVAKTFHWKSGFLCRIIVFSVVIGPM